MPVAGDNLREYKEQEESNERERISKISRSLKISPNPGEIAAVYYYLPPCAAMVLSFEILILILVPIIIFSIKIKEHIPEGQSAHCMAIYNFVFAYRRTLKNLNENLKYQYFNLHLKSTLKN